MIAFRRSIDMAWMLSLVLWSTCLGVDIARMSHRWSGIPLDVAMILALAWADLRGRPA